MIIEIIVLAALQQPQNPVQALKTYVYQKADYNNKNRKCLNELIIKESNWRIRADNPTSSAYGLFQMLKLPHTANVSDQTRLGVKYIGHRYGTACKALKHHKQRGWY